MCAPVCVCEQEREREREWEGWREERMDGGREEGFNPAWITGQTGAGEQEEREEVPSSFQLCLHPEVHL